jgi:hypothetical protein
MFPVGIPRGWNPVGIPLGWMHVFKTFAHGPGLDGIYIFFDPLTSSTWKWNSSYPAHSLL